MSQHTFTLSGRDAGHDPYAGLPAAETLREIAEILAARMAQLLPVALNRAASSLNRQAAETPDLDKRLLSLEAARLAQHRLGQLPEDFRRHFDRLHPRACRYDPLHRFGLLHEIEPDQLRVLDDAAALEALDARDLIQALQDGCQQPLHALLHHYRRLLQASDLPAASLPIGPHLIAQALQRALAEHPSLSAPKQRLLQALAVHLPELMLSVYRDLDAYIGSQLAETATSLSDLTPPLPELPPPEIAPTGAENVAVPDVADDASRHYAREVVNARLAGQTLPEAIRVFLTEHWQRWLADCHRRHGPDSPEWREAVTVMDALISSLAPDSSQAAPARLRQMPALLQALRTGMAAMGLPAEIRDRFLVQWMQAQAALIAPVTPTSTVAAANAVASSIGEDRSNHRTIHRR